MANLNQIPRKRFYKSSEVCQFTDTQPYVLRFWESEFPQLAPDRTRGGQPVYRREDIDLVLRIKQLLYDEEYTIEGARKRLEQELAGEVEDDPTPQRAAAAEASSKSGAPPGRPRPPIDMAERPSDPDVAEPDGIDTISRQRYDDALEEIAHLRLKLQEIDSGRRKAENRARKAEELADRHRRRAHHVAARLEKLLETLS